MSPGPWLSVVLPCRNQADHIGAILPQYLDSLERFGRSFELVAVPNACQDQTAEVVRRLASLDGRIRMVENAQGGWGLSVRTGLEAATGQVLCYTNSARTDPASLPEFLERFLQNPGGIVKARRFHRQAPTRALGSMLYNFEGRLLFGIASGDVNGTPKLFGRDFYRSIALRADGDLLDLELMAWARRLRTPIVELPVEGFRRHGGKSSTTLRSAWNMYAGAVALRRDFARLSA